MNLTAKTLPLYTHNLVLALGHVPQDLLEATARRLYIAFMPFMMQSIKNSANIDAIVNKVFPKISNMLNATTNLKINCNDINSQFFLPLIKECIAYCKARLDDSTISAAELKELVAQQLNNLLATLILEHDYKENYLSESIQELLSFIDSMQKQIDPNEKYLLADNLFEDPAAADPTHTDLLFTTQRYDLYAIFVNATNIFSFDIGHADVASHLSFIVKNYPDMVGQSIVYHLHLLNKARARIGDASASPVKVLTNPEYAHLFLENNLG